VLWGILRGTSGAQPIAILIYNAPKNIGFFSYPHGNLVIDELTRISYSKKSVFIGCHQRLGLMMLTPINAKHLSKPFNE